MQCFALYFGRLLQRKMKSVDFGLKTGVFMPNDVCRGDAFLRIQLRYPDDMTYKGSFEFTREYFLLLTLKSQKTDIPVDRVFLHRYLEFMSVAITDRAQVAQNESSLQVKSSYSSKFHISIVSSPTGVCINFLTCAKICCRYPW